MKDKKEPVAAIIMARMKGKKSPDEGPSESEAGDEASMDEGLVASSEEIMSAIKGDDPQALMEALKSFIDQC